MMNKATFFQSISDVVFPGIPLHRFPSFRAVRGGQTEREAVFLKVKSQQPILEFAFVCWQIAGSRRLYAGRRLRSVGSTKSNWASNFYPLRPVPKQGTGRRG